MRRYERGNLELSLLPPSWSSHALAGSSAEIEAAIAEARASGAYVPTRILGTDRSGRDVFARCLAGGAIGVGLGVATAAALSRFAGWQTAVTADALLLAFGFSAAVGLVFGLWPARRASMLDPIEALRHE